MMRGGAKLSIMKRGHWVLLATLTTVAWSIVKVLPVAGHTDFWLQR